MKEVARLAAFVQLTVPDASPCACELNVTGVDVLVGFPIKAVSVPERTREHHRKNFKIDMPVLVHATSRRDNVLVHHSKTAKRWSERRPFAMPARPKVKNMTCLALRLGVRLVEALGSPPHEEPRVRPGAGHVIDDVMVIA